MKKGKLSTPEWILEGYNGKSEWEKAKGIKKEKKSGKTFKIRVCPECGDDGVGVIIGGQEGKGSKGWECYKCKWKGIDVEEKKLSEDEFMKYLDERGEPVG